MLYSVTSDINDLWKGLYLVPVSEYQIDPIDFWLLILLQY